MKKILLATALSVFATSALANEAGTYYLRADVGASMLPQSKVGDYKKKAKSNTHFVGDIGLGYSVTDSFRAELVLSNHFPGKQKTTGSTDLPFINVDAAINQLNTTLAPLVSVSGTADSSHITQAQQTALDNLETSFGNAYNAAQASGDSATADDLEAAFGPEFVNALGTSLDQAHQTTAINAVNAAINENTSTQSVPTKLSVRPTVTALTAKGVYDVYDFGAGKVFAGAGLGLAKVGGKAVETVGSTSTTYKFKNKTNFSYLLTVGSGFDVAENVMLDVAYTYNNYGKLSKLKNSDRKINYKLASHDLTAGVRFAL